MATEKLDIMQTLRDGVRYGLKNFFPLLLMVILYVVTVWIPYLNGGTTIGLYKAVIGVGRGETIDPTAIFAKENFKDLSGFFLLLGLLYIGIVTACFFLFIPAIVMSIAWGFAMYFFLDKKVSPLKALRLSYDTTYGNKWRIFFVTFLCSILMSIIACVLAFVPKAGVVLVVVAMFICTAILVAIEGVMYDFFSKKADAVLAEKPFGHGRCCHDENPAPESPVDPLDEVTTEA